MINTTRITSNLSLVLGIILCTQLFASCEGSDDTLKNVNFNFYTEQVDDNTLILTLSNIVAVSEQNQSMALTEISLAIDGETLATKPYAPTVAFDIPSSKWPKSGDFKVLLQFYSVNGSVKSELVIWHFFSETPVLAVNHVFSATVNCTTTWDSGKTYVAVSYPGADSNYGEDTDFYIVRSDDYTFKDELISGDDGHTYYDLWRFDMFADIEIDYQNTNIQDPQITIESITWDDGKETGEKYCVTAPRSQGDSDWIKAFGDSHTILIKYTATGKMDGQSLKFSNTDECRIFPTPAQNPAN